LKRLLSVSIILTILISLFSGFSVAAENKLFVATLEYDGTKHEYKGTYFDIVVNDEKIETPIPPIVLSGGRAIVPVREIFEAMGANVYWTEGRPSRVVIANEDTTVSLAIGNNVAKVNGQDVKMEVAAKLVGYEGIGKTMVPVRFVAETLDMDVDYNENTGVISIKDKAVQPPEEEPEKEPEEPEISQPNNKLIQVKSSLSGKTLTAKLTFAEPIEAYTRMILDNPNRVVVDVEDSQIATGKYAYEGSGNVEKIRLGDYEGCARIVFDVERLPQIRLSMSSNKKVLTVILTDNGQGEVTEQEPEKPEEEEETPPVVADGPIVVIDPGHGGDDPGAIGYDEDGKPLLYEKHVNLNISRKVVEILKKNGVNVYITREDDETLSLGARTDFANELDASLFVSIHCNSYDTSDVNGTLVLHHLDESIADTYGVSGRQLANNILKYLPKAMETEDRGRMNGNAMFVIRKANMPSVIVETAFISNADDRAKLADEEYRAAAAEAIAKGILDTLKKVKK